MSRKSIVLSLLMILMLTALSACSSGKETPLESGDITKENVSQVCEILNQAGLSNVDVFAKWVKDSASGALENELVKMLSERPDYTSEEGDPAPVVYKNGERIGELER